MVAASAWAAPGTGRERHGDPGLTGRSSAVRIRAAGEVRGSPAAGGEPGIAFPHRKRRPATSAGRPGARLHGFAGGMTRAEPVATTLPFWFTNSQSIRTQRFSGSFSATVALAVIVSPK